MAGASRSSPWCPCLVRGPRALAEVWQALEVAHTVAPEMPSLFAADLVIDSPLAAADARAVLLAGLDESAAALGGYGTGTLPFHGRITDESIVLQRVHRQARRTTPPLRGRVETHGSGSRLRARVDADVTLLMLLALAALILLAGLWTRGTALVVVGAAGVALAWWLARRSAVAEASAMRAMLAPMLRSTD